MCFYQRKRGGQRYGKCEKHCKNKPSRTWGGGRKFSLTKTIGIRSLFKRSLAFVMAFFVAFSLVFADVPVNTIEVKAATSKTQDQAIEWCRSQLGQCVGSGQCVAFIQAYYQALGVSAVSGNGSDYTWNNLPSGWQRIEGAQPQKGDILVYTGGYNNYGHVAIYESDRVHYHQNFDNVQTVQKITYMYNGLTNPYWGVIRPNWGSSTPEPLSPCEQSIPDGDYLIVTAGYNEKSEYMYLDIAGTAVPAANETNVILSGPLKKPLTGIDYEAWTVKYSNGYYTITQKDTNMALDVYGGKSEDGSNVSIHESNGSDAQKWTIKYNERNGYRLQAKCGGANHSLDTSKFENGANVYIYSSHDLDNQSWLFIPYKPEQTLADGRYVIVSSVDTKKEFDLPGTTGDLENGTRIALWESNEYSKYNAFDITKLTDGYYKIKNVVSGKSVEIQYGVSTLREPLTIYDDNGSLAQQWAITKDKVNGGFQIWNKASGMLVDLAGAKIDNGTRIQQFPYHGNANQSWKFIPAEYTITYEGNGGTWSDGSTASSAVKNYKEDATILSTTPSREGYSFLGWSEKSGATSATYSAGDAYTKDENITLYAVWEEKETPKTVEKVSLNKDKLTLEIGGTSTLTATVSPTDAEDKTITWSSSDKSVATVSSSGKVTAVAAGTAVITAKTTNGVKATCTVTVNAQDPEDIKVETISVNPALFTLNPLEDGKVVWSVLPKNATNTKVTFKSTDADVVYVYSDGSFTAVAPGEADIVITAADGSGVSKIVRIIVKGSDEDDSEPVLKYRAYCQKKGWMPWKTAGVGADVNTAVYAGTTNNLRMETIQMQLTGVEGAVKYRAYCAKKGWTQWATTANTTTYAGTKGESRRVEMIQLQATGELAEKYDMYYRTYCEKFGWLGWAKSGSKSGSAGYARKLEALQIHFVAKEMNFSKGTKKSFYDKVKDGDK